MSSVRRAMAEMGLAGCCAWCDAPDAPGSDRCRRCIAVHKSVRDRLATGADGPIDQAARRLLSLMTEPQRHDHDPVHGPVLREQMRRLGVAARNKTSTQADVEAAFAASRARTKESVVTAASGKHLKRPLPDDWGKTCSIPSRSMRKLDGRFRADPSRPLTVPTGWGKILPLRRALRLSGWRLKSPQSACERWWRRPISRVR